MVAEWILPLVENDGAALIGVAATDVRQSAHSGIGRLFAGAGSRRQQVVEAWLAELPAVRDELTAWADRIRGELPVAEQNWMQTNVAGRNAYVVQHGNQYL